MRTLSIFYIVIFLGLIFINYSQAQQPFRFDSKKGRYIPGGNDTTGGVLLRRSSQGISQSSAYGNFLDQLRNFFNPKPQSSPCPGPQKKKGGSTAPCFPVKVDGEPVQCDIDDNCLAQGAGDSCKKGLCYDSQSPGCAGK